MGMSTDRHIDLDHPRRAVIHTFFYSVSDVNIFKYLLPPHLSIMRVTGIITVFRRSRAPWTDVDWI